MTMDWERALHEARLRHAKSLESAHRVAEATAASLRVRHADLLEKKARYRREHLLGAIEEVSPGLTSAGEPVWRRAIAAWDEPEWQDPSPSTSDQPGASLVRVGEIHLAEPAHQEHRLCLPALVPLVGQGNILFEATGSDLERANENMVATFFRVATTVGPGKVRFVGIDPVGLGQCFSSLLNLDESIRGPKILHEHREIEDALEELTAHMGTVIQKYLTNQYQCIDDYNHDAGVVAEPYRLLLVANFPAGFRPDTAERLISIAANGPRVGVHVLMTRDTQHALPRGFPIDDLRRISTVLGYDTGAFRFGGPGLPRHSVILDEGPPREIVDAFVEGVNQGAGEFDRVEVPFADFVPEVLWDCTSESGIEVAIGRRGARDAQLFRFGSGTEHHALVGGRTGSGKTILLHTLICNLALQYPPDELQLYLVDFKEGVEFSVYRDLPHARVVAIEAEREFGLSVVEGLREELTRRGDLCRGVASNLEEYRGQTGEALPRILLVIDEFQMFFLYNDRLAVRARTALDDLARRGRSFGIHMVLASQTLGGMDLDASTLSNISVRVALQMSEADSLKILGRENDEARLLSRPGEAIFNPRAGLATHNLKFQVAYLGSSELEQWVADLRGRADRAGDDRSPVVFEGNRAADLESNTALGVGLAGPPVKQQRYLDLYLGEPTVLQQGHAAYRIRRQAQGNLLMVGLREEVAFRLLVGAMASVAAQVPAGTGSVRIVNLCGVDSPLYDAFDPFEALPIPTRVGGQRELESWVDEAHTELVRRAEAGEATKRRLRAIEPPWFLVLFGAQRANVLRRAGLSVPPSGKKLAELLRDGPYLGLHVLLWVDTPNNLKQILSAGELKEFGGRVAFGGGEAQKVVGSALQAPIRLKPNYALLADDERPEDLFKIRCYGPEAMTWLENSLGWEEVTHDE